MATKEQLQLIGVTSMSIAAKYEEVQHPHIKDFAFITADTYTTDTICQMERIILKTLDYALSFPLAITFLRRLSKITTVRNGGNGEESCGLIFCAGEIYIVYTVCLL